MQSLILFMLLAASAWAADISGQWQGEWTDSRDSKPCTFTFKQDGELLTGSIHSEGGDQQIRDGKVSGDRVSFAAVRRLGAREMTLAYAGRVDGGEIAFKVSMPGAERDWHLIAKKASQ